MAIESAFVSEAEAVQLAETLLLKRITETALDLELRPLETLRILAGVMVRLLQEAADRAEMQASTEKEQPDHG